MKEQEKESPLPELIKEFVRKEMPVFQKLTDSALECTNQDCRCKQRKKRKTVRTQGKHQE